MKENKSGTNNKLNNPYRTNVEYAKKRADKTNTGEYNFEFGQDDTKSRYDYEFGDQANISAQDSPLARGANIANAFSYPTAGAMETPDDQNNRYNEEYGLGQADNVSLEREVNARGLKKKYQENLRQNYNVEFSDDELIDDNCDDCNHCSRCKK